MKAQFNRKSQGFDPQVLLTALQWYEAFEYPDSFTEEMIATHREYTKETLAIVRKSYQEQKDFKFGPSHFRTIAIALSGLLEEVRSTKKPLEGLSVSASVSRIQANIRLTNTLMGQLGITF